MKRIVLVLALLVAVALTAAPSGELVKLFKGPYFATVRSSSGATLHTFSNTTHEFLGLQVDGTKIFLGFRLKGGASITTWVDLGMVESVEILQTAQVATVALVVP